MRQTLRVPGCKTPSFFAALFYVGKFSKGFAWNYKRTERRSLDRPVRVLGRLVCETILCIVESNRSELAAVSSVQLRYNVNGLQFTPIASGCERRFSAVLSPETDYFCAYMHI